MQSGTDALSRDAIERLVKRAQEGETAPFAGLYEHFYDKIFRYIVFKTGSAVDAEDIAEEVFLRMLESISSFSWRGYPFSSWLFRIAHNLVVDYYRKKGRQKTVPIEDATGVIGDSSYDVDGGLDLKLSMEGVYAAMQGLSKLQRGIESSFRGRPFAEGDRPVHGQEGERYQGSPACRDQEAEVSAGRAPEGVA